MPTQIRPDEHDMTVPWDEWEDAVFANASYFTLTRRIGVGVFDVQEFPTFADLERRLARERITYKLLPYVISKKGHQVCLERKKFDHYRALAARWGV